MKKIITLIVVLALLLGLSAPAWAADIDITSVNPSNYIVSAGQTITVRGEILDLTQDVLGGDPEKTYTYRIGTDCGSVSGLNPFTLTVNADDLIDGNKVTLTLYETETITTGDGLGDSEVESNVDTKTLTFTVVSDTSSKLTKVELTSSGMTSVSTTTQFPVNASGAWNFEIPNAYSSVTVEATPEDSAATVDIYDAHSGGAKIATLDSLVAGTAKNFRIEVTPASGSKATYYYKVTRAAATSSNQILKSVSITYTSGGNTTTLGSLGAINGPASGTSVTQDLSINNPNNYSAANVSWVLADDAELITTSPHTWDGTTISSGTSVSLPTGSATKNLVLNIKASNGTTYTATIRVSRANSGVPLITNAYLRTSDSNSGNSLDSLSNLTSTSGTQTMTIPANNSYTTFYLHLTLPGNVTFNSVSGTGVTKSGNMVIFSNFYTTTNSRTATLSFTVNSTQHSISINLERANTSTTTLATGINIRLGSATSSESVYNYTSAITTNSSTINIPISSNYSNTTAFYAHVSLPSGVTLESATFGSVSASVSSSNVVTLQSFSTTYNSRNLVLVFKLNGSLHSKTITLQRGQNVVQNASLSSLSVRSSSSSSSSSYSLTPYFGWNTTDYDVDIPSSVSEVYIHTTRNSTSASVSVTGNGCSINTITANSVYRVTLNNSSTKTATIRVTNSGNTTTYTLHLGGSSKAKLSTLRASSTSSTSGNYTFVPPFNASITEYTVLVPYDGGSRDIHIYGTMNNSSDTLTIDGNNVSNNTWNSVSSINAGRTRTEEVIVEDSDGNRTTYKLNFIAAPSSASSDANLNDLYLRSGSSGSNSINISPSFSSGTSSYTADAVANDVSSVRVYANGNSASALMVNDVLVSGGYATVNLSEGGNTLRITVYAENCQTFKTYTISITRGASGSSEATLSSLMVRTPSQALNLIPAFEKNTLGYTTNVSDDITQISFLPTATDSGATIRIMGSTVTNGQWTSNYTLSSGSNIYTIAVTSSDGSSFTTYTVSVTRGLSVVVSTWQLRVNGTNVICAAYNINGNNYFKLRDLAYCLRGTPKHFNVTYNAATRVVSMFSNQEYSPIGGEMVRPGNPTKYQLSNQIMMVDNRNVNLTAYNVDGNNYFQLREIGALFNFGVTHDEVTRYVDINTAATYVPGL